MKAEEDVSDTDHYKQLDQDSCHYFGDHETHESSSNIFGEPFSRMILLFSMLSLKVFSVHSSANIVDCESGRKTAEYLEGQTFSLCCSLNLECNRTQGTDYLGIKKRNSHSEHPSRIAVKRTDRCVVRYSVVSAVTEDTGIYACYRNDDNYIFDNMDVTIIEKPSGFTIQSIMCSDLKDLNITFSYGNVNPTFDQVQVTLEEQAKEPMACQANCSASTQICLCQIRHASDSIIHNRNVTLRVNVTRSSIESTEFLTSINLIDFIVPSPVQDLSIFNISSTEVILKFRPTFQTKNVIHWMFERGKVLTYHVTLFSTSPMEKWKIQFNKTVLLDGKSNEFTAVWFQDLIPFTQYTLIVCCSGGGGQGQSRELTFITNQSVPLEPPEVDSFSYMRWYDISRVKSSCVFIIIKPLQRTSSDRKDVSFKAELTTHSEDLPKCYSICQLCQVPRDSFSVKLWTLNRIGQSKTYTEITIPTSTDATKPTTIVEFETGFVHLNVQLPSEYHIENLTIHWCHGENNARSLAICTDYPQHRFVSPGHRSLNISIELDDLTTDIYTTISTVRVFHLEDVSQGLLHDVTATQSTKTARTSNLFLLEKGDVSAAENSIIRIFVSAQVQGHWMGMVEAECYFDRNSGHANVHLSSFSDSSGQTFLRFGQHCDRTYQFKVATFHIYSSIDVTCNSTYKLDEVNSTLESHDYPVPKDSLFICLLAVGYNGQIKFLPALPLMRSSEDVNKNGTLWVLSIAAPLVLLIVLLTTGVSLMRRCQNRKSNFQEFIIKEKLMKTDAETFLKGKDIVDGTVDITRVSDTNKFRAQLLKDSDSPNQGNSIHGTIEKSFGANNHQGVELCSPELYKDCGKHSLIFQATASECSSVNDDIHCVRLSSRSRVSRDFSGSDDSETCDRDDNNRKTTRDTALFSDLNQCSDDQSNICLGEASSYLKMNLERENEDYRIDRQIPLTFCFSEPLCSDLSEASFDNISSSSQ
ncbi:hypothetical protein Bpfe_005065 [Biomphalaria pfeifferi]|uniref:Fibronectin type-III domain-containing protein n=1 Tax=Biomphalaria pfeifferi TaxID=112525 RepID=A0AAD8C4G0_BIOPF|nr:hypothetical protein Bpfe_005065 [Biomphalaria pfeifferi]